MKRKVIILLLILTNLIMNNSYATNYSLTIDLTEREISKDSNENIYHLSLKNRQGVYWFHKKGAHPGTEFKKEIITLDADKYRQVMQILQSPEFDYEINEIKPMQQLGISIDLEVVLKKDDRLMHSKIQGMYREMRTGQSNIEHLKFYHKIESIIALFKPGKY